MNRVRFADTTLRDGQSCIWGYRMTTEMILPIAARMDQAGFEAIEADSYNSIKLRVRQQKEEPWARIRLLAKTTTRTPLMIIGGPTFGSFSDPAPNAICKLRSERLAANGIRRVQAIGFMNDMKFKIPEIVRDSHEAGLEVSIGLVYAVSPKHSDEYYAMKTVEALELKPGRIYLKDPIGLLTPDRTRTIIPAILRRCGDTPLELHSHCTTGLAPLCYLEAIKAGVKIVHTGIPPLANGAAQPSVTNMAANCRLLGYPPEVNEDAVTAIGNHLRSIARKEGLPTGAPLEYDHAQQLHQIPGGVISNMKRQLAELNLGHRLEEVLEETARVRKDLGYPIMYTPFSQFVVTQATMNVVAGERYRVVSDEMIKYVLGYWGEEISSWVEPETRAKIVDRPRSGELAKEMGHEPAIGEIRQKFGGPGVSDDDLLMRYMMGGEENLKGLHPAGSIKGYVTGTSPLVTLIEKSLRTRTSYFAFENSDFKLVLQQNLNQSSFS